MSIFRSYTRSKLLSMAGIFAAFLITAQIGTYLYRQAGTSPAMIWAPVGIAIAAMIIEGYAIWPVIALAAIVNGILNGTPLLLIVGSALGNTIQPLVAVFVLEKFGFDRRLQRVKDMFLILGTALFTTMIVPTINAGFVRLYNSLYHNDRMAFWNEWWVGGALSALILTPFLIRWIRNPATKRTVWQIAEIAAALIALGAVSVFLFGTPYVSIFGFSLFYILLAALLWIAFRMGSRIMALALILVTAISLLGALYGTYTPVAGGLSKRIFNTEILDLFLAFLFFVVVSLEEQRKRAIAGMHERTAQLERAMAQIRLEDEAKNEFIATLAHELRNPLATVLSSVELLLMRENPDPDLRQLAETMDSRVQAMGRMLDDLLDISRITHRQLEMKKEDIDLGEVVRRSVESVDGTVRRNRQSLMVTMPDETLTVHADPVRLEQVFINLLSNASKYTPPGGQIKLAGTYKDGWASLAFSDTGIGIPPNLLNRIFEPFFQVKSTEKRKEGLGIGLALAKSLVEMHGGTITAKRKRIGNGSEFMVRLPVAVVTPNHFKTQERHADEQPSRLRSAMGIRALDILVVDDNVDAARGLAKLLSLRGHRTAMAHDGREALEQVPRTEPDVVLLDIGLPDMDGYEVAEKIKKMKGRAPILIALTGYGQQDDIDQARKAGFDHHLTKPVGLADIERALRENFGSEE